MGTEGIGARRQPQEENGQNNKRIEANKKIHECSEINEPA